MPGKRITDHQLHTYKQHRNQLSQVASAVKAGISERSAERIEQALSLTDLQLPTIKRLAGDLCAQSDLEGWPAHRFLEALLEHEINGRELSQPPETQSRRYSLNQETEIRPWI
jgi:hypothetical protein